VRAAVLGLAVSGCALFPAPAPPIAHVPSRLEYLAFREAHAGLHEPNYLPFMLHRFPREGPEGDLLVLCRWDAAQMPIEVRIDPPVIPPELQHEVHPRSPQAFVAAAAHALRVWERELEGLVTFRRVASGEPADLMIRLLGERAPAVGPHQLVLGSTEALRSACRSQGWDPEANRLEVDFALPELVVYLADEFGLLNPGQVERVAIHELGHALGMLGHSPMPDDMMFAAYRERSHVESLSPADINSFVSLYRLANGTHYGHVTPGRAPPRLEPAPPAGAPALEAAPHVDVQRGFALRFPEGWLGAEGRRGVFAANGPVWDFDASIEVAVWPYPDVTSFLARYGASLFADSWFRRREPTTLAGHAGLRIVVEAADGRAVHDFRLVPIEDESLLVVLVQVPAETESAWLPWIEASLATLRLSTANGWE